MEILLYSGAINDHKMLLLFRVLTNRTAITKMNLFDNGFSIAGIRSMVPFLQSANKLKELLLDGNNIQSEGFNMLFRALRDSPIQTLSCTRCCIESIEIDRDHIPKHMTYLNLNSNIISTDGCRGIAQLLQGEDATLTYLWLNYNKIDDEGVDILVDALQNNTSLTSLNLRKNDGMSDQGKISLLKLLNDISSITATLHSNHTLTCLDVEVMNPDGSFVQTTKFSDTSMMLQRSTAFMKE